MNTRPVDFLFPGHGSEAVNMTRGLYEREPSYRLEVDRCVSAFNESLGLDLKQLLFPAPDQEETAAKQIHETRVVQPALFTVEYSLAKVLMDRGLEPRCMLGHSVGEYVAAALAGVFSVETAIEIVVQRARLVQSLARGAMLAVALPADEVSPYLGDRVTLAVTAGQRQCILSGFPDSIADVRGRLKEAGIAARPLKVSHAFHSMMLDPILDEFRAFLRTKQLSAPDKPFISCLHGKVANPVEVQQPQYWVRQLREPVRLFEGIGEMAKDPDTIFLEVGYGSSLSALARGHPLIGQGRSCLSTCPNGVKANAAWDEVFKVLKEEPQNSEAAKTPRKSSSTTPGGAPTDVPSEQESVVGDIFRRILGLPELGVDENFLEAGGNSLMAMQVISRIRKTLSVSVPIEEFVRCPTIQAVSALVIDSTSGHTRDQARTGEGAESTPAAASSCRPKRARAGMDFSLMFFSSDEAAYPEDRYRMVMDAAQFADRHDFTAIWTPERHFNKFGGLYPNPSVLSAAIAATTNQIHMRAGSVVAPLHHPVRIAEEWSVVDNLSKGRVGIAFGSGFHPNDFLFAPEEFADRKAAMLSSIEAIRRLWRGGSYRGQAGDGREIDVGLLPRPFSLDLPIWLATTRDPKTFVEAGQLGAGVLTALLRLSVPELRERIQSYREALQDSSHDPRNGVVTVMLHTFVGPDMDWVRSKVEAPLKAYLRSHMEHTRPVSAAKAGSADDVALSREEEEALLEHAFNRYFTGGSLIGTEESCTEIIRNLFEIGVDEVACLVDFGVDEESVKVSLEHLNRVRVRANKLLGADAGEDGRSEPTRIECQTAPSGHSNRKGESRTIDKTGPLSDVTAVARSGNGSQETGYPLSLGQQRLWFLDQFEPDKSTNILNSAVLLKGELNVAALEQAIQSVVDRHGVLRSRIRSNNGVPYQVVEGAAGCELKRVPMSTPMTLKDGLWRQPEIQAELRRPFNLAKEPLFRAFLFGNDGKDERVLLLVAHHIVSDGWSMAIMRKEIAAAYQAILHEKQAALPELSIQYTDYCQWQADQEAEYRDHLDYWRRRLKGLPPAIDLPTDFPRPGRQTFNGAETTISLPQNLVNELRAMSRREGLSVFVILLGAFQVLLHRYTGKEDIVVGAPSAGRGKPEFENLVGFFVNNLVMRSDLSGDPEILSFLKQLGRDTWEALTHQDVPFEKLVDALHPERDLSRSPLFQVMFALQNFPAEEIHLSGLESQWIHFEGSASAFDLSVFVFEHGDHLLVKFQYNRDLFLPSTVERMAQHYQNLLEGVVADARQKVSLLPMLSPDELQQLLVKHNQTARKFDLSRPVSQLIEGQAARHSNAIAAVFPATASAPEFRISYGELNDRANCLARHLTARGFGPEVVVGIWAERSPGMLVALLGLLKAGGTYLPLDPAFPTERLEFMLDDAGAKLLIHDGAVLPEFSRDSCAVLDLKSEWQIISRESPENPPSAPRPDSLAYVIYTSGSTGHPKGVEISHRSLTNFLLSMLEQPGMSPDDRLLALTTLSFDIAGLEIFLPLIAGATVVVADASAKVDGRELQKLIQAHGITMIQATPSAWRLWLESGWDGDPNLILLCGGEPLDRTLADHLLKRCRRLWNMYGPTETTIWSSIFQISSDQPVLVGRPIANTSLFVLDKHQQPVPVGVPGELFIGGEGLARGYRNLPQQTRDRFVNTSITSDTLYRTGDLARWHASGNLEVIGRTDNQVKLRGYRIELGEVEAAILDHPDVVEAAVSLRGNSPEHQRLMGYVVATSEVFSAEMIQEHVGRKLPSYMIPAGIVRLNQLPRTANGKIDRNALPDSGDNGKPAKEPSAATGSITENELIRIWADVLGVESIGMQDNFFRLGGHSLTAVRVISRVNGHFSLELSVITLFENQTIHELSQKIDAALAHTDEVTVPAPAAGERRAANATTESAPTSVPPAVSLDQSRTSHEKGLIRGMKNRLLQLAARVAPNAARIRLHRWRGVRIGDRVGIGYDSIIETSFPWLIAIGNGARIGMRVLIIGHFAGMEGDANARGLTTVRIEEDVWIGPSVTILPNVTIGKGAVVAAGSTVTMSVPPAMFVQGNPAQPIARCGIPMARGTTYQEFIRNLAPL